MPMIWSTEISPRAMCSCLRVILREQRSPTSGLHTAYAEMTKRWWLPGQARLSTCLRKPTPSTPQDMTRNWTVSHLVCLWWLHYYDGSLHLACSTHRWHQERKRSRGVGVILIRSPPTTLWRRSSRGAWKTTRRIDRRPLICTTYLWSLASGWEVRMTHCQR